MTFWAKTHYKLIYPFKSGFCRKDSIARIENNCEQTHDIRYCLR
jgi:hypothetical protein